MPSYRQILSCSGSRVPTALSKHTDSVANPTTHGQVTGGGTPKSMTYPSNETIADSRRCDSVPSPLCEEQVEDLYLLSTLADEPIETMSDGGPSCFTKVTKSRPTALEGKRIQVLDACRCAGVRYSGSFGLWPNTFQCVESAAHHGSGSGELPSTCLESRELADLAHCAVLLLQPRTPERSARALPQLSALDRGRAP